MKYKALSVILFTIAIVPSALAQRLETRSSGQAPGGHAMAKPARLTALSRLWQNEIQELPADHSALFAASREVSIELEVPSNTCCSSG